MWKDPASPRLLVGCDDHYTIGATTLAMCPPYEVGRILRGTFHGTFFFSRHTCVSWLLNPYAGLGQYNRIYCRRQERGGSPEDYPIDVNQSEHHDSDISKSSQWTEIAPLLWVVDVSETIYAVSFESLEIFMTDVCWLVYFSVLTFLVVVWLWRSAWVDNISWYHMDFKNLCQNSVSGKWRRLTFTELKWITYLLQDLSRLTLCLLTDWPTNWQTTNQMTDSPTD